MTVPPRNWYLTSLADIRGKVRDSHPQLEGRVARTFEAGGTIERVVEAWGRCKGTGASHRVRSYGHKLVALCR